MKYDLNLMWSIFSAIFVGLLSIMTAFYKSMSQKIKDLENRMTAVEKEQAVRNEDMLHINSEIEHANYKLDKIETSISELLVATTKIEAKINPK